VRKNIKARKEKEMKYKIAIIGLGSIGALKADDVDYPGGPDILTHANAITAHQDAILYAVVDSDIEKLKQVKKKWNPINSFSTIEQMYAILQSSQPDIVVVATPTDTHYQVINDILKHGKPKLIIAEKPFCNNLKEAQTIMAICEERQVPVCIDYIRRFSKGHKNIKALIDAKQFGEVQNVRVLYTRGKHDSCHATDLMHYFLGDYQSGERLFGRAIIDRDENDPTLNYQFAFEKCENVFFHGVDGRKFGIFEIDIIFDHARIRLIDNGIFYEIYPITENNKWGHAALNYSLTSVIRQETGLSTALYNLLDNTIQNLSNGVKLLCTDRDAVNVHKVYNRLKI
jgi:predicted dehydrogenase